MPKKTATYCDRFKKYTPGTTAIDMKKNEIVKIKQIINMTSDGKICGPPYTWGGWTNPLKPTCITNYKTSTTHRFQFASDYDKPTMTCCTGKKNQWCSGVKMDNWGQAKLVHNMNVLTYRPPGISAIGVSPWISCMKNKGHFECHENKGTMACTCVP